MTEQQYRVHACNNTEPHEAHEFRGTYRKPSLPGVEITETFRCEGIERPVPTADEAELTAEQRRQRMCPCTLEPIMPSPHLPTREQIAPLPADARMDAYYYGFDRTGVGFIDAILSAVAIAGKGAHHTESWGAPWEGTTDYFRGHPGLPDAEDAVDLIQKAAQQAADAVLALIQNGADR